MQFFFLNVPFTSRECASKGRSARASAVHGGSGNASPVNFERVAFYENPGILMIIQNFGGEGMDS